MVSSDIQPYAQKLSSLIDFLHQNFIWLLLACYLLAAVFPGPGLAIRRLSLTQEVTAPLLLLALLLFCASAVVRWSQVRELLQHPGILLLGLIAVWLIPGFFVSGMSWFLPELLSNKTTSGILVGLAIVAAMPVANSSVAWSQNAQGNVALALGLIVLTIVLCPVATPQMLNLMGLSLSSEETAQCNKLVTEFSGAFFIVWVILPAFAGMLLNRTMGAQFIEQSRGVFRLVSAITLLTLNYANASLALPQVINSEAWIAIVLSGAMAIGFSLIGILSAWVMSQALKLDTESRTALTFGFSMKHTGLALVLAGEVLHEEPRVIMVIVLATLLQHVVAGVADWYLDRNRAKQ